MEKWGADLYGDPCRECGFGWDLSPAQAVASVGAVPDAYARRHLWDIDRSLRAG